MNKELEQQAREWYEAEERKRLASVLDTNGDPMFDEETISVASAANARSLAPRLVAFVAHLEAQSKPIQGEVGDRSSVTTQVGEPVAWRSFRRHYMRISYPLHNAFAILGYDTLGDIIDHLGVKITDDHDANYFRLKKALMKMRGIGQLRATDGASAIMEIIERATPSTVPLSPEMVEKMVEEFLGWMSDEFDTQGLQANESPGHELAHQRLRTRLLGIR